MILNNYKYFIAPSESIDFTYHEAIMFCAFLNIDDHFDWYIPTIKEWPFILRENKNLLTADSLYWSSSTAVSKQRIWTISENSSRISVSRISDKCKVRAIRKELLT